MTVTAYLRRPDGGERRAVSRSVPVQNGAYRAKLPLSEAGSYRIVTAARADGLSLAGESPPAFVEATPAG